MRSNNQASAANLGARHWSSKVSTGDKRNGSFPLQKKTTEVPSSVVFRRSGVRPLHAFGAIPFTMDGVIGKNGVQLSDIFRAQPDFTRGAVFLQTGDAARTGNHREMFIAAQQPGQGDLRLAPPGPR